MSVDSFRYAPLLPETEALRRDVRAFLGEALKDRSPLQRADSWMGADPAFSRELGRRGWIGMTLPKRYGGAEATPFARYVVIEELLAAGAPVSAHWIADRQSGPLLLRYGTERQRDQHLPAICRGESYFCIGMSEPNSGSDLASVRTRAVRSGDGWVLDGHKLWTTNAHYSQYMIAVVRTGGLQTGETQAGHAQAGHAQAGEAKIGEAKAGEAKVGEAKAGKSAPARHAGLSQFIVDLRAPGVTVRPIRDLSGSEHFNEVFFDQVMLGADALVGTEGQGWDQVTAELAYERSGPERFLSSIALLHTLIDAIGPAPDALQAKEIGRLTARLMTLRQMSLSVTAELAAGRNPAWAASCVKDLGTAFEQELPEVAHLLLEMQPATGSGATDHARVLAALTQLAPSFSLRGGTREILRGIIARGLGLR